MLRSGLLVVLVFPMWAMAQMDPIETDRPDQTETAATVPAGWLQAETGVLRGTSADGSEHDWALPTLLFKVGLTKRIEFRSEMDRARITTKDGRVVKGFTPLELGFKARLFPEKGWRPRTSLLAHLGVPGTGTPPLKLDNATGLVRLLMDSKVNDLISLGWNFAVVWGGPLKDQAYLYTLTCGYHLSDHLNGFTEIYGAVPTDGPTKLLWDAGLTYSVNNDLQLDMSCGRGVSDGAWFGSAGISWRLQVLGK